MISDALYCCPLQLWFLKQNNDKQKESKVIAQICKEPMWTPHRHYQGQKIKTWIIDLEFHCFARQIWKRDGGDCYHTVHNCWALLSKHIHNHSMSCNCPTPKPVALQFSLNSKGHFCDWDGLKFANFQAAHNSHSTTLRALSKSQGYVLKRPLI